MIEIVLPRNVMRQHSVNLLVIVLQLFEGIPLWVGWGWRVINSDEEKFYACLSALSGLFPVFSFEELNSIRWNWIISTHDSSEVNGHKAVGRVEKAGVWNQRCRFRLSYCLLRPPSWKVGFVNPALFDKLQPSSLHPSTPLVPSVPIGEPHLCFLWWTSCSFILHGI